MPQIQAALGAAGAVVVVAPPGAGKTTRVPPALADDGALILLQPRRVAARALARRIAHERNWTVGNEVGWQVRHERRFSRDTRLLVATEGILNARLIRDPLLSAFRTVVLDEFHERSLHADLALALIRQAREARADLRVVVMSATLDAAPVAEFLGGCPIVEVDTRTYPLSIDHAPGLEPAAAIERVLGREGGDLLTFLPGAPEIHRVTRQLGSIARLARVFPLHGSLDTQDQESALAPCDRRKVILATNIAETSLTVEGVTDVIDSGLHKVMRLDPASGFDRLETERISLDSADQRAGRAGRVGPGQVLRLWDPRDEMREHREPEIHRVDLATPLLDVLAWGDDPRTFRWFEPPAAERVSVALELLEQLGALAHGTLTPLGRAMRRLPLPPRLARVALGTHGAETAIAACTILAAGWLPHRIAERTESDLLLLADRVREAPPHVRLSAAEIDRIVRGFDLPGLLAQEPLCRAVLAAYPDRVARRRRAGSSELQLASGSGAELGEESGVRDAELLVAVELRAPERRSSRVPRVRIASAIDPEWIVPTSTETVHEIDASSGRVRAFTLRLYDRLELQRQARSPDPQHAAGLLSEAMLRRGLGARAEADLKRIQFAGLEFDLESALREACLGREGWFEFAPLEALDWNARKQLDALAPEFLRVPSGKDRRLAYGENEVSLSVKLQELFGLAATPCVGRPPVAVTLHLLAPNGRPVQSTRDLRSFWETTYPEVRKQLRGRYPKHPWPEDPWTATPTARTRRRP